MRNAMSQQWSSARRCGLHFACLLALIPVVQNQSTETAPPTMNVSNMTTLPPTPVPTPDYQVMHTGLEHKKTIRLLKGESTYFLVSLHVQYACAPSPDELMVGGWQMDTFNLTTECRQIHDYCPGTNL